MAEDPARGRPRSAPLNAPGKGSACGAGTGGRDPYEAGGSLGSGLPGEKRGKWGDLEPPFPGDSPGEWRRGALSVVPELRLGAPGGIGVRGPCRTLDSRIPSTPRCAEGVGASARFGPAGGASRAATGLQPRVLSPERKSRNSLWP